MNIFKKKTYVPINIQRPDDEPAQVPIIKDGMWTKCPKCEKTIYVKELSDHKVCVVCKNPFRIGVNERLGITVDENTFSELFANIRTKNPMNFPNYEKKIDEVCKKTGIQEAVISGECEINGEKCIICIMDSNFIMGSMGSVVGEKITRSFEHATENNLPIVIFTASGGARMQEGINSLMQMAKISAAAARHNEKGLLYITVLTDPTTGGVTASFAMQGDVILSEPNALIGFAGARVIENTIKQKLPEGFQRAEFLLEHGFIDKIVKREELKNTIGNILKIHSIGGEEVL
ncbi:MAG: acetyl-CoA carboxylase, carboxyltransferase subunit beta [Defluviitaleaceae bacterium]|nr:acetyl-CoA carboxylase, carboxyltransferase subunit beta [Defluviitaleaceae bacterium]